MECNKEVVKEVIKLRLDSCLKVVRLAFYQKDINFFWEMIAVVWGLQVKEIWDWNHQSYFIYHRWDENKFRMCQKVLILVALPTQRTNSCWLTKCILSLSVINKMKGRMKQFVCQNRHTETAGTCNTTQAQIPGWAVWRVSNHSLPLPLFKKALVTSCWQIGKDSEKICKSISVRGYVAF